MIMVSWNCAGAFRGKFLALAEQSADICVVQECEDPKRSANDDYKRWAENYHWVGSNKNSGLGVFVKPEIQLELLDLDPGGLELFLPCRINRSFILLAVWTKQANSPTFQYIGQLWKYLQVHRGALSAAPLLIVGDLNSNVRWDKWDRWWNHSDVVRDINALGSVSAYHHLKNEAQGKESEPTFFLQRNLSKPYHIDYAFLPEAWLSGGTVCVGRSSDWIAKSDHMPLRIEFDSAA